MKTLTVIVLGLNGLALTRATLDRARACRVPEAGARHVMVVDNASTDGSPAAIAAEYPWVDLQALAENRQFAGGNNVGIARALDRGADAIMRAQQRRRRRSVAVRELLAALEENLKARPRRRSSTTRFAERRDLVRGRALRHALGAHRARRHPRGATRGQYRDRGAPAT